MRYLPALKPRDRSVNAIACAICTLLSRGPPWRARSDAIRKSGEPSPPKNTGSQNEAGSPSWPSPDTATVPPLAVTAAHTAPSPTASARGVPPIGIVRSTAFDPGLTSMTMPRSGLATHTEPSPTATATAPSPTGIDDGRPPFVSIRHNVPSAPAVTQAAPSPTARPSSAVARSATRRVTAPVSDRAERRHRLPASPRPPCRQRRLRPPETRAACRRPCHSHDRPWRSRCRD